MIDYSMTQNIGYVVTRNIGINRGQQYTYYTYKVVSYDDRLRTFHNLTTSNLLSNNQIIKTLSANFENAIWKPIRRLANKKYKVKKW